MLYRQRKRQNKIRGVGEPPPPPLYVRVLISHLTLNPHYFLFTVEDSNIQEQDKSEALRCLFGPETSKITHWRQEFVRRRILAAEIYARCVEDYNLMFYLSDNVLLWITF